MSNVNTNNDFSEYVLKAIQGINSSKLCPGNHTIFNYANKNFATNADASLIDTPIQILLNNNPVEKRDLPIKATPSLLSIHLVTFKKLTVMTRQTSPKF